MNVPKNNPRNNISPKRNTFFVVKSASSFYAFSWCFIVFALFFIVCTVPAVRKDETQVRPLRSKNLFSYCRNMFGWFGRLGGGGTIIRIDVRRVFSSHIDEKSGKPPKSFSDFLTLVIRHRFFFFVPETLHPFFCWKYKKTRTGIWIEIRAVKS